MDISRLEKESRFFRHAIERYQDDYPDEVLVSDPARINSKFPHDCCKSASWMLGHHLSNNGFENIQYANGHRSEESHGWLEIEGVIVDITADQFADEDRPVIVARSDESGFHAEMERQQRFPWKPSEVHAEKAQDIISHYKEVTQHNASADRQRDLCR